MDPLIQKLADEIQEEELNKTLESERFVQEQRIRSQMAPRIWQDLRNWLKQGCEDLAGTGRKIFEFEVWPNTEAKIRRLDKPAALHVEFDPEAQRVFYECGAGKGEFLFRVNPDTTVVLETVYHVPYTIPEAGRFLLDMLRKSNF